MALGKKGMTNPFNRPEEDQKNLLREIHNNLFFEETKEKFALVNGTCLMVVGVDYDKVKANNFDGAISINIKVDSKVDNHKIFALVKKTLERVQQELNK